MSQGIADEKIIGTNLIMEQALELKLGLLILIVGFVVCC